MTKAANSNLALLAYLAAFIGVCGHASSEFVAVLTGLHGVEVSVWRFFIGSLALIAVALMRADTRDLLTPLRQDFWLIAAISIGMMTAGQFIFHWSLNYATVVQVATIVTIIPIATVFFDRVINGTPVTTSKIIAGIGAFIAIVLLMLDGRLAELAGSSANLIGVFMAMTCAVLGGLYIVMAKPMVVKYGAIRITTLSFALGWPVLFLVSGLFFGKWMNPADLTRMEFVPLMAVLAIGIWNTCIGFILWLWGIGNAPDMGRANYLFFLKPVIAALLSLLFLNQRFSWLQVCAIIAIVGFVALEVLYQEYRANKAS